MAKSTRSKVKRSFRAKKRTNGVYAAVEAARLNRLHRKLKSITMRDDEEQSNEEWEDMPTEEGKVGAKEEDKRDDRMDADTTEQGADDAMDLDANAESSKKISTHGPRGSRREQWRLSKGMPAKPQRKGMNRQGGLAARRKSGRSHRRR